MKVYEHFDINCTKLKTKLTISAYRLLVLSYIDYYRTKKCTARSIVSQLDTFLCAESMKVSIVLIKDRANRMQLHYEWHSKEDVTLTILFVILAHTLIIIILALHYTNLYYLESKQEVSNWCSW